MSTSRTTSLHRRNLFRWPFDRSGFTLVEMAIVIIIVGIVISIAASVLPSLIASGKIRQTRALLEKADFAIQGYSIANFRLPFADNDGDGFEDAGVFVGTLPFRTLGLSNGNDIWTNPILYGVYGVAGGPNNLTQAFADATAFCTAITNASTSAFDINIVHTTTANPCNAAAAANASNQAFVLASGGLKDLDGANAQPDDCNGQAGAGFNIPGKIQDNNYDDLVRAYSLNELNQKNCGGGGGGGGGGGAVEICDDVGAADEDGDGDANCADTDCAAHPSCVGPTPLNITTTSIPSGVVNSSYMTTFAASGGTTPYSWTLTNNGGFSDFAINGSTGTLTGTLDQCPASYTVAVQVQDSTLPGDGGPLTDSDSFTLQVNSDLAVNRTSGAGTSITWSSATQLETFQATGGRLGNINWSLNSGGATGFSVISTGADTCRIQKTGNTAIGNYTFVLTATDATCAGNTADITLTVNVTGSGGGFPGNITGVVDTLEFYTANIDDPDIIATSGTWFAIAFTEGSNDGRLNTISIDGSGNITDGSEQDFDSNTGFDADMIPIGGDVYAVAYEGPNSDGWLRTVTIDGSGNVSAPIDSHEFETAQGEHTRIVHISGDIYGIVYRGRTGGSDDGWIDTVSIQSNGTISGPLDRWEFDTSQGEWPSIVPVSGNVYAIAYQGPGDDGWIKTVSIDGSGNITPTGSSLEFDTGTGNEPVMVHVSGDTFAVAYQGPGNDGWLRTVSIDVSGNISGPIASLEFETNYCNNPDLINLVGEIFVVAYEGPSSDGWMQTISIDAGGNITSTGSSLEFDTGNGVEPSLVKVSDTMVAVAYSGAGADGFVSTISIE